MIMKIQEKNMIINNFSPIELKEARKLAEETSIEEKQSILGKNHYSATIKASNAK